MEIESGQTDKLLRYTGSVQANCEFLTFIKNTITHKSRIERDKIRTLDTYMQDLSNSQSTTKLHFEGLVMLIIQLAYFLYSCKNVGKSPVIQLDDIRVEESYVKSGERRFNVVIFYRLSDQNIEDMYGFVVFKSIMDHIEQALHPYIQSRKETNQISSSEDKRFQAAFQTFWRQFQQLVQNQNLAQNEVKLFLLLQQTSLFYQYSLLYRIKTCSLIDYIKTNQKHMQLFKDFKTKEENLINNYNQQKKRSKENIEVLRAREREIENNLLSFFEKINTKNVQSLPKSTQDQTSRVQFHFKLKQKQKKSFEEVIANLKEETMNEQTTKEFMRPLTNLKYFVQYSSEKNSICVKLYVPSIFVNVQTSDFLMFQSNVLTFDAANISIQLSQPEHKDDYKVPKKIVTFKGTSSFNIKEPPLQKILLLMDITMIASRIYQPEMNSQKHTQGGGKESYLRLNNVTKKVSHYTKLFMKCAKKVYDY